MTKTTDAATVSRRILCPPWTKDITYFYETDGGCTFTNPDAAEIMRLVSAYFANSKLGTVTLGSSNMKLNPNTYDYRSTSDFERRRVMCPRYPDPAYEYELIVTDTGEILICSELSPLLNAACDRLWQGNQCVIKKSYAHGYPKSEYVLVEIVQGVEGRSISLDGTRIAGSKPWGGGQTIAKWNVEVDKVVAALRGKVART